MISRKLDEKQIKKARALLERSSRVTVICHTSPDGDALGASLAAARVLSAIGKDTHVVIPDTYLNSLSCLPGIKEVVDASRYPDFATRLLADTDLILCLDFNTISRVGRLSEALAAATAPKILIDHHLYPDIDAEVVISHPEMAATSYLMFRFLCRLELFNFIDRRAAECMLAGMMTDTGNFSYNCSDPELYTVVAELIAKGANKEHLYQCLFNTFSADCLRLRAYAILKKMNIYKEAGGALITLSRDELNRFHYSRGDTEGLVNRPLSIPGVRFSIFMRQESDCTRISMRSLGDFPVNELCSRYFNGGGHLNAAGGEFFGSLDDAIDLINKIMPEIATEFPLKKHATPDKK